MRRVVITGMGAVTPLGLSFQESWKALLMGRSGMGLADRFSGLKWPHSGEIRDLDLGARFGHKEFMRNDRFVLLAAIAADEAVSDSGLSPDALKAAGVVIGSSRGGISRLEAAVTGRVSAFLMSGTTISMAASCLALRHGARGHVLGISNACASGLNAVGEAMRLIREGRCEAALAGGSEAPLTPLCLRGYGASGALSPSGVMRPFDSRRNGFVLSEGAAVLVLEEREAALGRGACIYAEVAGYGNTADAYHPTAPLSEGQAAAITSALREAGLAASDIGHISAHATSTPKGDRAETQAIREVFGPKSPPVSAIKSMTGHMLAASGAFEAAAAANSLREGVVPPTINAGEPEDGLDISALPRELEHSSALCHSFGFGGVNAVLALMR
jgi:3-oxoacyl-[acyl-carrier-protein] synthase II